MRDFRVWLRGHTSFCKVATACCRSTRLTRSILVGVIGGPHGVRGEVRLKSFTDRPDAIANYGRLRSEDGRIDFIIRSARRLKGDMVVARLDGVSTRAAAAALTGVRLTVDRRALPPADEGEFYHTDLIGLAAVVDDGTPLGRVAAVLNYGAGDILEVVEGAESRLIAFTKAFVPTVDLEASRIIVAKAALLGDFDEVGQDRTSDMARSGGR